MLDSSDQSFGQIFKLVTEVNGTLAAVIFTYSADSEPKVKGGKFLPVQNLESNRRAVDLSSRIDTDSTYYLIQSGEVILSTDFIDGGGKPFRVADQPTHWHLYALEGSRISAHVWGEASQVHGRAPRGYSSGPADKYEKYCEREGIITTTVWFPYKSLQEYHLVLAHVQIWAKE